jgi:structural maintenance of chromosome 2
MLAPGKVDIALSFISYEKDVQPAVEYVFGSTLLCQGI